MWISMGSCVCLTNGVMIQCHLLFYLSPFLTVGMGSGAPGSFLRLILYFSSIFYKP